MMFRLIGVIFLVSCLLVLIVVKFDLSIILLIAFCSDKGTKQPVLLVKAMKKVTSCNSEWFKFYTCMFFIIV